MDCEFDTIEENREMDRKKHSKLLMKFKNDGVRFSSFMGARWIVLKVLLIIVSLVMLSSEEIALQSAGFIVVGYLLGVIAHDTRRYFVTRKNWSFQKDIINWRKVEANLGNGDDSKD